MKLSPQITVDPCHPYSYIQSILADYIIILAPSMIAKAWKLNKDFSFLLSFLFYWFI